MTDDIYLTLKKGKYFLNSSLQANLLSNLDFSFGKNYLLTGDNGTGKSSFIKNVILPELDKVSENKFLYYHTEQDISVQYYIIKSYYKGLKRCQNSFATLVESLNNLKRNYLNFNYFQNLKIVFVLDEIDQFLTINDFVQDLLTENMSIIIVSHNEENIDSNIITQSIKFTKANNSITNIA